MSFFQHVQKTTSPDPPAFDLNGDQEAAIASLDSFCSDRESKTFGVFGPAGTGKTSVITRLFTHRRWDKFDRVCLAAPTHKAVGVLAQKAPSMPASTLHRLLGCKSRRNYETGEKEFLPDDDPAKQPIGDHDIVVADECSMIGETMHGWLKDAIAYHGTKIIWLGDPYQLAPVKDGDHSPTFEDTEGGRADLSEIMRHEGVIQRACNDVREAIERGERAPFADAGEDDSGEIVYFRNSEDGIARLFDRYLESSASAKILAFKNDDVDWCNGYVRKRLYGDSVAPFVKGERLVVKSTSETTTGGILHTGTDCVVLDAGRDQEHGLDCWRLYLETDHGFEAEILAFGTKEEKKAFIDKKKGLLGAAKSGSGSWPEYFEFIEAFAMVRPGYATTIHKSQGSTFERVFLLQSEMRDMWDHKMRDRLLYVAYSRARKGLYLI